MRRSASFGARACASGDSRSNASPGSRRRSGSASSTLNGPTSSRRSVRQCPPSASGDRPNVRPRADAQVEARNSVRIRDDVERVDLRTPQGHVHLHTAPRQPVGALAADLHRRGGGDRQLDLTAEGLEAFLQHGGRWRLVPLGDLALRVAGRGRRREVDVRDVSLVQSDEARLQLSCPPGQHQQETGRKRIERPRVARARARSSPQVGDHLERRRSRRLVDERHSCRFKRPRNHEWRRIPCG